MAACCLRFPGTGARLSAPPIRPSTRPPTSPLRSNTKSNSFWKQRPSTSAVLRSRSDILSAFVGIRPLVKAAGSDATKTSALSRDHTIHIDSSGLLTIVGGKWTTYRHMAEDAVNHAITLGRLDDAPCITRTLRIHGYVAPEKVAEEPDCPYRAEDCDPLLVYGADAEAVRALAAADPRLAEPLDPELPIIGAQIIWAAREEMARTLDDALARRTRALLLNAAAAERMAPASAALLAQELGKDRAGPKNKLQPS